MRLLIVYQGQWGERILDHIRDTAPSDWQIADWRGPACFPNVIDDPDEFVPDDLPQADLILVLTEHAGMTDLTPDLAQRSEAKEVLLPIDKRSWAPPGLVRQVKTRLQHSGISLAAPMPFCSLAPNSSQSPLIRAFAERYGRPQLTCAVCNGRITACQVIRQAPCGNTRYVSDRLPGTRTQAAPEQAGLLHHYYPCWGGMEADPVTGEHTLLHIAASMTQQSIKRALETGRGAYQDG